MTFSTKIDCIIPFYNEGERILTVIKSVLKTPEIGNIICVDDGSDEVQANRVPFPQNKKIKLIKLKRNFGKSHAVRVGLKYVKTKYVFLIDADLIGLTSDMLSSCINYVLNKNPGMLIVQRINTLPLTRLLRMDIIVGGERIILTSSLKQVLKEGILNYQLEPAINNYFLNSKHQVVYTQLPIIQFRKIDKVGLIEGVLGDLKAVREVVDYIGWFGIAKQIKQFNPKYIHV